jgi:ABC-type Fe3+ transport system permease subunit
VGEAAARVAPAASRPSRRCSAAVALLVAALAIYPLGTVLVRIFFTDGTLDLSGCGGRSTSRTSAPSSRTRSIVVIGSSAIALVLGGVLAWSTSGPTRGWAC